MSLRIDATISHEYILLGLHDSPAVSTTEIWIKDRAPKQQWSKQSPLFAATFCSPETLFHDQHVDQVDIVSEISSISELGLYTQPSLLSTVLYVIWKPGSSPQDISCISLIQTLILHQFHFLMIFSIDLSSSGEIGSEMVATQSRPTNIGRWLCH